MSSTRRLPIHLFVSFLFIVASIPALAQVRPTEPDAAALSIDIQATGRILCGGQPLPEFPVELWDSDARGSHLFDDMMASGFTEADGRFLLRGYGGDPGSRPDVYVRAVYGAQIEGFASDGTRFASRVDVEDEVGRTRYDSTDVQDEQVGHVSFGDIDLHSLSGDCNVFREARAVVRDWHGLMFSPFPSPGGEARILRWTAVDMSVGTPHTMYDIVKLPTDAVWRVDLRRLLFHELGHMIWFSLHSSHTHWVADMGAFVYGRHHNLSYHARDAGAACNTRECAEGFAMSEGFAYFWEGRSVSPVAVSRTYTALVPPADPAQEWEYEGNVRNRLRFLAGCLGDGGHGYAKLVRTGMRPIPLFSIHSLPEFENYALGDHPELQACISRNAPDLCGRGCRTDVDCGSGCPRCVPIWMGDVQVSQCRPARQCGQGCRTNADCADPACGTCTPIWYGDVAVSECR